MVCTGVALSVSRCIWKHPPSTMQDILPLKLELLFTAGAPDATCRSHAQHHHVAPCNEPCEHGCALLLVHCLITADPPTTCMNQPSRHWCPSCPRHSYHHHHHDSTSWHAVPLLLTYCISRAPDPTQPQLHTSDTPVCPAAAAPPAMLGQAQQAARQQQRSAPG